MKGNTRVSIHSEDDLIKIWRKLGRGETCALWCDGETEGNTSSKRSMSRSHESSSESDDEEQLRSSRKKKRKNQVL